MELHLTDLAEVVETLSPSQAAEYAYEPLKYERSIRLLGLQPASSTQAPLQCDLQEVLLSDECRYEAISYVWGEPVFPKHLDLPTGSLKITESLSLALQRFRLGDRVRYLWADAICINQNDNTEKGRQVALMGEIYRNCQNVLVWLGPGDEYSGNIIHILKRLAAQSNRYGVQYAPDGTIIGGWEGSAPPTESAKEALESVSIEYDWSGVEEFYSLSWFSRLWVVQEVGLAPSAHLYCGTFDIAWQEFILAAHIEYRAVNRATAMNIGLPSKFYQVKLLESSIRGSKNAQIPSKLLRFLGNFFYAECSDDRDRVFALLSLRGTKDVGVTPNYYETAAKIYIELATEMVREKIAINRNIFYYAGVARKFRRGYVWSLHKNTVHDFDSMPNLEKVCSNLPSWVPDWSITGKYVSFHVSIASGCKYLAASQFNPQVKIDPRDRSLSVVARSVDTIQAGRNLGLEPELDYNAHREQVLLLKEFYDQQIGSLQPENEDAALTRFARTIIADNTQAGTRASLRDPLTATEAKSLWLQFASTPYKAESPTENFESDGSESREVGKKLLNKAKTGQLKVYSKLFCYRLALKSLLDDRQVIFTDNGFFGLAPSMAQAGDYIVVFAGLDTPLILRPGAQDDLGGRRYYIIGDCFVHGLMYGELFEPLKRCLWQWVPLS